MRKTKKIKFEKGLVKKEVSGAISAMPFPKIGLPKSRKKPGPKPFKAKPRKKSAKRSPEPSPPPGWPTILPKERKESGSGLTPRTRPTMFERVINLTGRVSALERELGLKE